MSSMDNEGPSKQISAENEVSALLARDPGTADGGQESLELEQDRWPCHESSKDGVY